MIYGEDCEKLQLLKIGEILGLTSIVAPAENLEDLELKVETRVPKRKPVSDGGKVLRIQVFRAAGSSFFARPVPLVFYGSLDWGRFEQENGESRDSPKSKKEVQNVKIQ